MMLNDDEFLNPVAERNQPDSGDIIKPGQVKPGDVLFCPDHDCKDPERKLSLKRSSLGKLFFSHRPGCGHTIQPQTLLHKMAVKWFEGKGEFEVPSAMVNDKRLNKKVLLLDREKTQLEFRHYQSVIPDVIVQTVTNLRIAIEIVVTSDVTQTKALLLDGIKLPTVCIDLTSFYLANKEACRTDIDFIKSRLDSLLQDISRKRWVQLPAVDDEKGEFEWKQEEPASTGSCVLALAFLFIISFAFIWLVSKIKSEDNI